MYHSLKKQDLPTLHRHGMPYQIFMKKKANVVGIVPARGGSKGVPKKNIKEIGGFPMIAYSIAASPAAPGRVFEGIAWI